jgi:hypothetical protein
MPKAEQVLELIRNKTKRVNLALNPKLWKLFEESAASEGLNSTSKIEDLLINYLETKGVI